MMSFALEQKKLHSLWCNGTYIAPSNNTVTVYKFPYGVQLDVFIFSRELAYQIADQFRVFGKHVALKDAVIVGGVGKWYTMVSQASIWGHLGGGGGAKN